MSPPSPDAHNPGPGDAATTPGAASHLVDWRASLRRADHACCCPAPAVVVVIMPPSGDRRYPVDLLLCSHHYQASKKRLAEAGAIVLNTDGTPFTEHRPVVYARK